MPSKRFEAIPEQQVLRRVIQALNHPLRVAFLEALAIDGVASASSFSRGSDYDLSATSYHLNVLHKECRVIELVGTRRNRGGTESFYRAAPLFGGTPSKQQLPQPLLEMLLIAVFAAKPPAAPEGSVLAGRTMVLDKTGKAEVDELLRDVVHQVRLAESESQGRLARTRGSEGMSLILGAVALPLSEAADPEELP